jgi:hypothetical protein
MITDSEVATEPDDVALRRTHGMIQSL